MILAALAVAVGVLSFWGFLVWLVVADPSEEETRRASPLFLMIWMACVVVGLVGGFLDTAYADSPDTGQNETRYK